MEPEAFWMANTILKLFWTGCVVYAVIILLWDLFVMRHRGWKVIGWDIFILIISAAIATLHHNIGLLV